MPKNPKPYFLLVILLCLGTLVVFIVTLTTDTKMAQVHFKAKSVTAVSSVEKPQKMWETTVELTDEYGESILVEHTYLAEKKFKIGEEITAYLHGNEQILRESPSAFHKKTILYSMFSFLFFLGSGGWAIALMLKYYDKRTYWRETLETNKTNLHSLHEVV